MVAVGDDQQSMDFALVGLLPAVRIVAEFGGGRAHRVGERQGNWWARGLLAVAEARGWLQPKRLKAGGAQEQGAECLLVRLGLGSLLRAGEDEALVPQRPDGALGRGDVLVELEHELRCEVAPVRLEDIALQVAEHRLDTSDRRRRTA